MPLRTTFTYAVPEICAESCIRAARVLVPFRKKALVGVVVELADTRRKKRKSAKSRSALDLVPALTLKLIELAHWIAEYYLAPVGEVFRAMLPPVTECETSGRLF